MFSQLSCKCKIVKNFTPSWFASVMWTWILAVVTLFYSKYFPILGTVSKYLFYFNVILFCVLLIPWILRWIFFTEDAKKDLYHPIVSNFYPTLSVWMLVLAADFVVIWNNIIMWKILWLIWAILTLLFGLLIPYIAFTNEEIKIDHINPWWFIPPVGLIVIPIAWSVLLPHFAWLLKEFVIFLNFIWWWAGFFLYLALSAICMYRFILHKPLPNILAPTIWINLWPIWAWIVSLINLVKHIDFITLKEPFYVFWLIFWWFGIWWVIMAIMMTLHYIKNLKLPYAMSWWAFTFPLGAYVAATHLISITFNLKFVDYIGFILYILLVLLWTVTVINTFKRVYNWSIFEK